MTTSEIMETIEEPSNKAQEVIINERQPHSVILDIVKIVDEVEKVPREYGTRMGSCGFLSAIGRHAALYEDLDKPRGAIDAKETNIWKLHATARGITQEEIFEMEQSAKNLNMPTLIREVLGHAILLVKVDERTYLVDTSFCQFMDPNKSENVGGNVGAATPGKIDEDLPQKLLKDGFVELNDEILVEYLRITSLLDATEAPPAAVNMREVVRYVPQLLPDYQKGELDGFVFDKK